MKIVLKLLIAIIFTFSLILSAQDLPIAGQEYKIVYDPSINGILTNSDSINLVYAFDYWGTTYS